MKDIDLLREYEYYYESYLYYDIVKKEKEFSSINLSKCNLLCDLYCRYFEGDLKKIEEISLKINEKFKSNATNKKRNL